MSFPWEELPKEAQEQVATLIVLCLICGGLIGALAVLLVEVLR